MKLGKKCTRRNTYWFCYSEKLALKCTLPYLEPEATNFSNKFFLKKINF